ncbi:DMT family transporter [Paenibacillus sp. Leaf72]|uniref:DMT family transporter n=1 Tax=Paenibacillus sp. Leaf72 TaxID=1736234 RepID=UPI0006FAD86A|nr:DMT family transporter [Paenibacillus sp. Leaf72]KQN96242.1 hypothetical protein ASF12_25855 [Paenibacillus sp. Leaf72]
MASTVTPGNEIVVYQPRTEVVTVRERQNSVGSFTQMMDSMKQSFMGFAEQGNGLINGVQMLTEGLRNLNAEFDEMARKVNVLTDAVKNFNTAATTAAEGAAQAANAAQNSTAANPDETANAGEDAANSGKKPRKIFGMPIPEMDLESALAIATASFSVFNKIRDTVEEQMDAWNQMWGNIAAQAGAALKQIVQLSIEGALKEQEKKDMLIARTGSEEQGTDIFNRIRTQSLQAGIDPNEGIEGTYSLMPMAANVDQLTKMSDMTMQLAVLDPAQGGVGEAADALKAAMGGDMDEFASKFNIAPEAMEGFDAESFINNKDMDGFLNGLNQVLEKANLGKAAFDTMMDSPSRQISAIGTNLTSSLSSAGMGAIEALSPLFAMILDAFNSGRLQPYFDMLGVGLTVAAEMLSLVGQLALWVVTTFAEYWPIIAAMLLAAGAIYLPIMLTNLWAMITPLLMQAAIWAIMNWPILLIVAAVGLLIAIVMMFGATASDIVGFVTGVFYALFANIYNIISLFWDYIISFAEFFANIFIDPVYAIKNLFYNLVKNVAEFFGGMVNGVLDGLNWIIEKINSVADTKISLIPEFDASFVESLKPTSDEDVVNLDKYRMGKMDLGDSFAQGNQAGKDMTTSLTDKLSGAGGNLNGGKNGLIPTEGDQPLIPAATTDKFTPAATADMTKPASTTANPAGAAGMGAGASGGIDHINKVDEVGKINDTVDIGSEDIKTMRELAEMKNIQNFVSLQPTVSVQTGDINNGTDIDTIISRIERSLNEQIASSAEGVYA